MGEGGGQEGGGGGKHRYSGRRGQTWRWEGGRKVECQGQRAWQGWRQRKRKDNFRMCLEMLCWVTDDDCLSLRLGTYKGLVQEET